MKIIYLCLLRLALKWTLSDHPQRDEKPVYRPLFAQTKWNSYHLPWILRSLMNEPEITKNEFWSKEFGLLRSLYEVWVPQNRMLQQLRYKMAPIQSNL